MNDPTELFADMPHEEKHIQVQGSFSEKRKLLSTAIDEHLIGQRITAIKLSRVKSEFSFEAKDGEQLPVKKLELIVECDNKIAYILRVEAVIKDMGEALANIEDEGARE